MKRLLKIKILKTDKDLPTPKYKHHGDAGMDLYSTETTNIQPGEIKGISTGIKIAIPLGYEMQIRPRSGLAVNHGISMINTPGTIDQGYRGIVHALLVNHGKEAYEIKRGERIAQAVFKKVEIVDLEEVNAWEEDTERGTGGFGSSGRFWLQLKRGDKSLDEIARLYPCFLFKKEVDKIISYETVRKNTKLASFVKEEKKEEEKKEE